MSKFKVGDYVSVRARIAALGGSEYPVWLSVGPDEEDKAWVHRSVRLKLLVPKRKPPKPAVPDRVMVAAALMPFVLAKYPQNTYPAVNPESDEQHNQRIRLIALAEADALIAEGGK